MVAHWLCWLRANGEEMKPYAYVVEYRDEPSGKIKTWPNLFRTLRDARFMWAHTTRPWHRIVPLYRGPAR